MDIKGVVAKLKLEAELSGQEQEQADKAPVPAVQIPLPTDTDGPVALPSQPATPDSKSRFRARKDNGQDQLSLSPPRPRFRYVPEYTNQRDVQFLADTEGGGADQGQLEEQLMNAFDNQLKSERDKLSHSDTGESAVRVGFKSGAV